MLSLCSLFRFNKTLGGVICLSGINTYDHESDFGLINEEKTNILS